MHAKSLFRNLKYMHDMNVSGFKLGGKAVLLEIQVVANDIFLMSRILTKADHSCLHRPKRQGYHVTLKILAKLIFIFEGIRI